MEHPLIDSCPSCGNPSSTTFLELKDWFLSREKFTLAKCLNCTLVYTKNVPINLGAYYKSEEYISHSESKSLMSTVYKAVQSFTLNSKKRLLKSNSLGLSILDYGAGKGDFSDHMLKAGFNVIGFEPDQDARNLAFDKHQLKLNSSIETIENNSIDAITMWHVLEHIPNPNKVIEFLLTKLKHSGVLIIAVPNYNSHDADHYQKYWAAYDVPRHVTHFDIKSMTFLMQQNGLEIKETRPMLFDSTYVSLLSEKYKTTDSGKTQNFISRMKAVIIGFVSNLALITNKNRCSSIVYVIKRK